MKKSYIINKCDLNDFLKDISAAMTKAKTFYNVSTKPVKGDDNKIKVVIG